MTMSAGETREELAGLVGEYQRGLAEERAGKNVKRAASNRIRELLEAQGWPEVEVDGWNVQLQLVVRRNIPIELAQRLLLPEQLRQLVQVSESKQLTVQRVGAA